MFELGISDVLVFIVFAIRKKITLCCVGVISENSLHFDTIPPIPEVVVIICDGDVEPLSRVLGKPIVAPVTNMGTVINYREANRTYIH